MGMHYYDSIMFLDKGQAGRSHTILSGDHQLPGMVPSYNGNVFDWEELFKQWVE